MKAQLQRVERQRVADGNDELAVEQELPCLEAAQHFGDFREVSRQRLAGLRRQRHLVAVASREATKAVPLGLELPAFALGQLGREQCFHWCRNGTHGHSQTIAQRSQSFPLRPASPLLGSMSLKGSHE